MRIEKVISCGRPDCLGSIGDGRATLTLTDVEVGTVSIALNYYLKNYEKAKGRPHVVKADKEWEILRTLVQDGEFMIKEKEEGLWPIVDTLLD